ncbi:MAG: CHASE2 domain-containing protein, partial [Azonexus sp.]|nr:CHASE2 domain-containing protein [Azonexus sp.]
MEFRLMASLQNHSSFLTRCLIVLMACACAALLEYSRPPLLERIDESIRDVSLRFFADTAQEKRIAIVDIDEESLRQVGAWPWSREKLAELVEKLISHHGARSVALDIVLPEPGSPSGDTRLAMLAEHGPLILSQILDYAPRQPALAQGELSGGDPGTPIPGSPVAHGFIGNHPGLARARCSGNIGYIPDPDGVLRHLPLLSHFSGRNYPHLSVRLLDC